MYHLFKHGIDIFSSFGTDLEVTEIIPFREDLEKIHINFGAHISFGDGHWDLAVWVLSETIFNVDDPPVQFIQGIRICCIYSYDNACSWVEVASGDWLVFLKPCSVPELDDVVSETKVKFKDFEIDTENLKFIKTR